MKNLLILCLILALFLCSCANEATGEELQTTTPANSSDVFDRIALDAAEARADYYQNLVVELQKEIVSIKNAHASAKVEYESRIEELEIALGIPEAAPSTDFQYTTKDGEITVTAYVGSEKVVSIPEEIGGCPVTYIADAAFENNRGIEKVILPKTLRGIGWFAFRGCIALSEIEAPASIEKIEYGAFDNCNTKLTLLCPAGSYVEEYAQSYGYATQKTPS